MKNLSLRWLIKGKLKLVLILLFTVSIFFISYQLINYASLTEFQSEESEALLRLKLLRKEKESHNHGEHLVDPIKLLEQKQKEVQIKKQQIKDIGKVVLPPQELQGKSITGSVLGVAPEYWKYYTQHTPKFSCLSLKNRRISWDKVNDDYCDCPVDGSDEPSTSACMNGKFYCTTSSKTYAEYIPSSRVNDGICDCCDGSDEYLKPIHCKNICR